MEIKVSLEAYTERAQLCCRHTSTHTNIKAVHKMLDKFISARRTDEIFSHVNRLGCSSGPDINEHKHQEENILTTQAHLLVENIESETTIYLFNGVFSN